MPPAAIEVMRECYRNGASRVVQDASRTASKQIPPGVLTWIRDAGVASQLLTPFGDGPDMLGVIAAPRLRPGRPWTQPEIEAVESIAGDIGRGLRHARLYEVESQLVAELRPVDAMKTDSYTTVAHELRSPLASIEGCVEMLSDPKGGIAADAGYQLLEMIGRAAGRLRDLIEDIASSGASRSAFRALSRPMPAPRCPWHGRFRTAGRTCCCPRPSARPVSSVPTTGSAIALSHICSTGADSSRISPRCRRSLASRSRWAAASRTAAATSVPSPVRSGLRLISSFSPDPQAERAGAVELPRAPR